MMVCENCSSEDLDWTDGDDLEVYCDECFQELDKDYKKGFSKF